MDGRTDWLTSEPRNFARRSFSSRRRHRRRDIDMLFTDTRFPFLVPFSLFSLVFLFCWKSFNAPRGGDEKPASTAEVSIFDLSRSPSRFPAPIGGSLRTRRSSSVTSYQTAKKETSLRRSNEILSPFDEVCYCRPLAANAPVFFCFFFSERDYISR